MVSPGKNSISSHRLVASFTMKILLKSELKKQSVTELCREHGMMNSASFHKWLTKHGGIDAPLKGTGTGKHAFEKDYWDPQSP